MPPEYVNVVDPILQQNPAGFMADEKVTSVMNFKVTTLEVPSHIEITVYYVPINMQCDIVTTFLHGGIIHKVITHVSEDSVKYISVNWHVELIVNAIIDKADLDPRLKPILEERVYPLVQQPKTYDSISHGNEISRKSLKLPGMDTYVSSPCGCEMEKRKLWGIIQHLNDVHEEWTREKIADWIDELHDSGLINAEFSPWGQDEPEESVDFAKKQEMIFKVMGIKDFSIGKVSNDNED